MALGGRDALDDPITFDILANDSDADGDPLLVALTMPVHGMLAVNPDQSVTYSPDAGFIGVDDFTYTIDDGRGGRSSAVVVIEVTKAANQAPTEILLDNLTVAENAPGAVVGRLTVVDPDAGDSHQLTVDDPRFTVAGDLLKLVDDVALDYEAEPSLTLAITATDAAGLSLTRSFTIQVLDADEGGEAPVMVDDFASTVANRAVAIPVLANDTDPAGGALRLVALTSPAEGTAVIGADDVVTYTPGWGFIGRDSFTYTTANDAGLEAQALVTIDVAGDGEPFSDGTFFTDGTGWTESIAA